MTTHRQRNGEPHPIDIHVGRMIRNERIARGLSQTDLSLRLGVSFQQVQKYENGKNRVSCSMLATIAKALHVKVAFFFPDDDNQNGQPESVKLATVPGATKLMLAFAKLDPRCQTAVVASMTVFADALEVTARANLGT